MIKSSSESRLATIRYIDRATSGRRLPLPVLKHCICEIHLLWAIASLQDIHGRQSGRRGLVFILYYYYFCLVIYISCTPHSRALTTHRHIQYIGGDLNRTCTPPPSLGCIPRCSRHSRSTLEGSRAHVDMPKGSRHRQYWRNLATAASASIEMLSCSATLGWP